MTSKLKRKLEPWAFSTGAALCAIFLFGLIAFALYDSVSSAQASEEQVRATTLSAELSNFLLATREPDGSSLLENPADFSLAERPLGFVKMKRSFYTYILNRGNARALTAEKINWEPPRPCILELSSNGRSSNNGVPFAVQACFAVIPSDLTGRYAYFTVRYPVPSVSRHRPGARLVDTDRVVLTFGVDRPVSVVLVYEPPTLAASRYPSQSERFSGIHEMAAFLASSPDRALRQVNAQAFERVGDNEDRRNFVTIVGRLDANLLGFRADSEQEWPTPTLKNMKIGLDIFSNVHGESEQLIKFAPGGRGRALVSLQNAYLSSVPSGSTLEITRKNAGKRQLVWSSSEMRLPTAPRREDWRQKVFDWWAPNLMAMVRYKPETASVELAHRIPGPEGALMAKLTAPQVFLPGFATRAFGWLTAALLLTALLVALGGYAIYRLRSVTLLAWAMAFNRTQKIDTKKYGKRRDEFSTLWRVLNSLYSRKQSQSRRIIERAQNEAVEKAKETRLLQTRLELRQERLDAIGHEIRSPLASLLVRTDGDAQVQSALKRIQNAVETIFDARSVEDGIQSLNVICSPIDLAAYLSRLVQNTNEIEQRLEYRGPSSGLVCVLDEFLFETVIYHLLDNAQRYKTQGSLVRIQLTTLDIDREVIVEVFNQGKLIPEDKLKSVFFYRNTDRSTPQNQGIGLYSARAYLLRMEATIEVANRDGGVAFEIRIPLQQQN